MVQAYLNCGLTMYKAVQQQHADKASLAFKWQKGMPGPTPLPEKYASDVPRVVGTAVALLEEEDDVEAVVRWIAATMMCDAVTVLRACRTQHCCGLGCRRATAKVLRRY